MLQSRLFQWISYHSTFPLEYLHPFPLRTWVAWQRPGSDVFEFGSEVTKLSCASTLLFWDVFSWEPSSYLRGNMEVYWLAAQTRSYLTANINSWGAGNLRAQSEPIPCFSATAADNMGSREQPSSDWGFITKRKSYPFKSLSLGSFIAQQKTMRGSCQQMLTHICLVSHVFKRNYIVYPH